MVVVVWLVPQQPPDAPVGNRRGLAQHIRKASRDHGLRRSTQDVDVGEDRHRRMGVDALLDAMNDQRRADGRKTIHRRRRRHGDELGKGSMAHETGDVGQCARPHDHVGPVLPAGGDEHVENVGCVGHHLGAGEDDGL